MCMYITPHISCKQNIHKNEEEGEWTVTVAIRIRN
jgi:hypothetical protein